MLWGSLLKFLKFYLNPTQHAVISLILDTAARNSITQRPLIHICHTGRLAPKIISNQCCHWLKQSKTHVLYVINTPFMYILQIIKGDPRPYFEEKEINCRGRHCCQISKQNVKTVITPLVSSSWGQGGCQKKQKTSRNSNCLVSAAVFQPKLNKLRKTTKKWCFSYVFWSILDVFEDCMILTEKQRLKRKNSSSL